ncbi:hypothetical protein B0H11DRAFT_116361 [Mycena galericulata]|nr:hypothetical protein B0H11DRAFT_116361 [Mycena galericulata]
MAITTLESQRRNSVVLLETCLPPPLPGAPAVAVPACPAPRPAIAKELPCAAPCRWESTQASRRRRLAAAERAFLDARRPGPGWVPPLLTHVSRFPSRTLPPPGVRACNLDATDDTIFLPGQRVRVRRFTCAIAPARWTEWQPGTVWQYLPMRSFIGNFGHAYFVVVQCPQSGKRTIEKFAQFIGEISLDDDASVDSFTSEECAKRRSKADYVYTRIPSTGKISGIPFKDVWSPAQVIKYVDGQDVLVRSLTGPKAGQKMFVKEVLPYTLETAVACRKQDQNVIGPDGKLFLYDLSIKPLAKTLPETLPKSILNLPSPAILAARPVSAYPHPSAQQ